MKKYVLLSPKVATLPQVATKINVKGEALDQHSSLSRYGTLEGLSVKKKFGVWEAPEYNAILISGGGLGKYGQFSQCVCDVTSGLALVGKKNADLLVVTSYAPPFNLHASTIA